MNFQNWKKRFEDLETDAFKVMAEIECEKCYNNEAILKLPTKDVSFLQSYELRSFGFFK